MDKHAQIQEAQERVVVYVADAYSSPYPVHNTSRAVAIGTLLLYMGYAPVVPHLTQLWDQISPLPYPVWLGLDLAHLNRYDVIYRSPNKSSGADGEVEFFKVQGRPVVYTLDDLIEQYPPQGPRFLPRGEEDLPPQSIGILAQVGLVRRMGIPVSQKIVDHLKRIYNPQDVLGIADLLNQSSSA
jgi:hypothetical protein